MKVTKTQLKKIIKEETHRALSERLDAVTLSDMVDELGSLNRSFARDDDPPSAEEAFEIVSTQLFNLLSMIKTSMHNLEDAGVSFDRILDAAVEEVKEFG